MAHDKLLQELDERRAKAAAMGGEEKLSKRHNRGQLNAWQRMEVLVDEGSFIETGLLGASSIEVDSGGIIRSAGANGGERSGGGAGGTVALFTDLLVNEGTISAPGGSKGCSSSYCGGDGGEGWIHTSETIQGIVNESFPKGMEIWVDGQNVTALVGDPNGKGAPTWDAEAAQWGADGLEPWSTGVLDLTNVADWTLGEHTVTIKETGGAGGQIKAYIYVVHTYSKSEPPLNNSCDTPLSLDVTTEPIVVSGTTEDLMGKTLATDASSSWHLEVLVVLHEIVRSAQNCIELHRN